jgi:hypothetical protein
MVPSTSLGERAVPLTEEVETGNSKVAANPGHMTSAWLGIASNRISLQQ